jgi:glycosyltransferase involved in cell wall biosynthesis
MKVGFYIPNRNHGHVIGRVLDAAVHQGADDILVVDDASTDNSREIIATYPVRLFCHAEKTLDHCESLAPLVSEMNADYVVGVGADDLILEGLVDSIRSAALAHSPGVVFGDYEIVDCNGSVLDVRRSGFSDVTYLSPSAATERLRGGALGVFECGVGSGVSKQAHDWLSVCGAWRMGPWIDSIGNSVAACKYGAVYVPRVLASFTVQPNGGNWHSEILADKARSDAYRKNIMEFFCHQSVAGVVSREALSAIATRWGA